MLKILFIVFVSITSVFAKKPDIADLPGGKEGTIIEYGYELLTNTAKYLGPKGKVAQLTGNKMSCQNCHLDGGSKVNGNSWLDSHFLYPQYRLREGVVQTLSERTNTCFKNNLLSKPLPEDGDEMKAILMYYKWLCRNRKPPLRDLDDRMMKLPFLNRAADIKKGEAIYKNRCVLCHGNDGQGRLDKAQGSYLYPPLWGTQSFRNGASLSRLSMMARFVKGNMPFGAKPDQMLSDEDAWDVSAYVLSHKRPKWVDKKPFPNLSEKPFDFPFGPYADSFSEEQHRLGPYQPILDYWRKKQGDRALSPTTGI